MTITIYTDPQGREHTCLPHTYQNTTNITEQWALNHGWIKGEKTIPDPPKRYSKYLLHKALASKDLFDRVWGLLTDEQRQLWNDANELAEDDNFFAGAIEGISQALGISQEEIENILEACEI